MTPSTDLRIEHDFLGDRPIPADAYWGVHSARAVEIGRASCRERVCYVV